MNFIVSSMMAGVSRSVTVCLVATAVSGVVAISPPADAARWAIPPFRPLAHAHPSPEALSACSDVPSWVSTPTLLPVEGWFSDGYRWRDDPLTGERRFHRGLDIVAPAGTIVRAPADGFVMQATRRGGYGNFVEIHHGPRYTTRHAHLEALLVHPGDRVRIGQPIGLVGSSGRAKGSHLHYEVLDHGRRVNPWRYLTREGTGTTTGM